MNSDARENALVEELGYPPTYRRVFRSIGSMSMILAMASPIFGVFVQCGTQILYGGYWGLTWGWFIPAVLFMPWALATAELCSSMPVNGANYWWTAALAPPSISRSVSFVAGMTNVMAAITSMASFSWAMASSLAMIIGLRTGWAPSNAIIFAIAVAISLAWLGMASMRMQTISILFIFNASVVLLTTGIFIIGLPVSHAVQGLPFTLRSEVFGSYKNYSDWNKPVAVPMTFFAVLWVVTGWNAPSTVAEKTHNASIVAPRSIISTYSIQASLGFVVLIVLAFCITDIDAAAVDETGFPVYSLIMTRWGPNVGFAYLLILMLNTMCGGASVLVTMSCQLAAFARDGGLIFNKKLSYVGVYSDMPIYSSIFVTFGGILMLFLGFSAIASRIIYSLAVISIMFLYITPMVFRVFDGGRWVPGPWNLGKFSKPVHVWSILSVIGMVVLECFPPMAGWTAATFNYNWIILLFAILASVLFWYIVGSKNYCGPDQEALAARRVHGLNFHNSASQDGTYIEGIKADSKEVRVKSFSKE